MYALALARGVGVNLALVPPGDPPKDLYAPPAPRAPAIAADALAGAAGAIGAINRAARAGATQAA